MRARARRGDRPRGRSRVAGRGAGRSLLRPPPRNARVRPPACTGKPICRAERSGASCVKIAGGQQGRRPRPPGTAGAATGGPTGKRVERPETRAHPAGPQVGFRARMTSVARRLGRAIDTATRQDDRDLRPLRFPGAFAFVGSGCLLVLEIVAGRIIAPNLGVSLYTWTSVI